LRKKYNERGAKEAPDGGFVDPEEVFSAIFGGDRFVPIIGDISLGKEMKAALQEAEETTGDEESARIANGGKPRLKDAKGKDILSPEEKAKKEEKERKVTAEVRRTSITVIKSMAVNFRIWRTH
jgi:X-domain of DnaJ-containing